MSAMRGDSLLSPDFPPASVLEDCAKWLSEDNERYICIQRQTHTGRPCGSSSFLDQRERRLDRSRHPQERRKTSKEEKAVVCFPYVSMFPLNRSRMRYVSAMAFSSRFFACGDDEDCFIGQQVRQ